ncbi:MAG: hypothetical protein ACK2T7_00160 [Anaerolineales bacterium]
MEKPPEPENINKVIGKYLKTIAEQQARQNEYLKNISAVLTFLLVAFVLFVLVEAAKAGIF